ncbi:glycosyltransferase family 39 protein [uncultured Microbacterium sp.]|uniref:glycosyltransferase family 39 protein n=1 Tax=uncultured Microbacterium sp. TaxID=191216 RepID=UPI0025E6C198|nr:glycosyltransferase family 39 protein [uncultured Microbacterium sp.]
MSTAVATASVPLPASTTREGTARRGRWVWPVGLVVIGVLAGVLTLWGLSSASQSNYYAAIALSMSESWSNFFFGSFDPAGTVTLDKIPGSFWIPALFIKTFGFSAWAIIAPNGLAAIGAALITAVTARRIAGTGAGLFAGAIVATTPILVAVSRSNQPEMFFVLCLSAVAWAATHAVQQRRLRWLLAAGAFIALAFQTYMLEAWAVWPALAAAYLTTKQPWLRKIWHLAVAGIASLVLSLSWIIIVSLIPAESRPYIGSTIHNSAWEMVFGYNGLGRFSATVDSTDYNSFTPPFSGSASAVRLFNEQLAGQIAWLIPAALVAIVVLWMMKFSRALVVLLGGWFLTFGAMFSAVAGMHQFYTASLAIPMALLVGTAFAWARRHGVLWAQLTLLGVAALTALAIGLVYRGYSIPVALVQLGVALVAGALIVREWRHARGADIPRTQPWIAVIAAIGMLLTPAAWSAVTLVHPSSTNPVAGGVSEMSMGFGMGGRGGAGGTGAGFGGQTGQRDAGGTRGDSGANGFPQGQPPSGGTSAMGQPPSGGTGQAGGPGGSGGMGQPPSGGTGQAGGPGGSSGQTGTGQPPLGGTANDSGGFGGAGGFGGTGGFGGATSETDSALVTWLQANQSGTEYLIATFGAQYAASLIIGSGGESVLPIGGFSGNDPVPTLAAFQDLIASGDLKYVLVSAQGAGESGGRSGGMGGGGGGFGGAGGMGGSSSKTTSASEIRSWVEQNCTAVTDAPSSGIYACSASSAAGA